jgi:multiple sugar transport system substrate-binding protein
MGAASDSAPIERVKQAAAGRRGHRRSLRLRGSALAAVVAAALALAGIAGCGPREPKKRVVVFWQFSPLDAIQPLIDQFERENPDLDVQIEQLTWQSGREKIVTATAAGQPPDLCELGSTFLPGLVADSTLLDLTDSIPDLAPKLRGWDMVRYRGRAYALPWMIGTRALYFNRDLLRQVRLDPEKPPATWADLLKAARLIDEANFDAKGFGMNSGEREVLFKKFMPFAWGNGGAILDSTLTRSVVASPQNIEALRFYVSLRPFSLLDRQEMLDEAFARGRLGFTISGPWLLRTLPKTAPTLDFEVALMPRPAAGKGTPASFAGAEALGIFRAAANPAGALRLARYLVRSQNAMKIYAATGNAFPAAVEAAQDSFFIFHPQDRVFMEQLKTAVSPPLHPRWVDIEDVLNAELEGAIYGRRTPEEALRAADLRIGAILAGRS